MPKKKDLLFISWSGRRAQTIAESLKKEIFREFEIDVFVSPDIDPGKQWAKEITENLTVATAGLVIVTDYSVSMPWLLYETGYLVGRLKEIPVLTFGTEIPTKNPLSQFQFLDGEDYNQLKTAVRSILSNDPSRKFVDQILDTRQESWQKVLDSVAQNMGDESKYVIKNSISELQKTLDSTDFEGTGNQCLLEIASDSLAKISSQLLALVRREQNRFRLPREQYPYVLSSLQGKLKCETNAVAFIGEVESFWHGPMGENIVRTSHESTQRIFVFQNRHQLEQYITQIVPHAVKYKVFITSKVHFSECAPKFSQDFSIIKEPASGSKVLAKYDSYSRTSVEFSADEASVMRHERVLSQVASRSIDITKLAESLNDRDRVVEAILEASEELFAEQRQMTQNGKISAWEYDKYEEDHPFFREMMGEMLASLPLSSPKDHVKILELGAGTGHFTKRLAQIPMFNASIVAVEYDSECFAILFRKFTNLGSDRRSTINRVDPQIGDSIEYNPDGTFDFVFSSFAEHHISPADKQRYFENVKRNLSKGAKFIVGDEFLPPHDLKDAEARRSALVAYHETIIKLAEQSGHFGLAQLERSALENGIDQVVDFKCTLHEYIDAASSNGLKCLSKLKVSDGDYDKVGGIFVLEFELA